MISRAQDHLASEKKRVHFTELNDLFLFTEPSSKPGFLLVKIVREIELCWPPIFEELREPVHSCNKSN